MEISATQTSLNPGEVLPDSYGEDRLILLPRDPHWIFAYWEVTFDTIERLKYEWGKELWDQAVSLLRVYSYAWERKEIAKNYFDINMDFKVSNWHIKVGFPDHFYHVELGWQIPGQNFFSLLKSNLVRTPRDGISDIIDENWKLPDWKTRRLYYRISLYHLSSPEFLRPQGFKDRMSRRLS